MVWSRNAQVGESTSLPCVTPRTWACCPPFRCYWWLAFAASQERLDVRDVLRP